MAKWKTKLIWIVLIGVFAGIPLSYIVSRYPPIGGLQLPYSQNGRVVDFDTGKPITNATIIAKWRIYDYPMIDGAGSYTFSIQTNTDSNGMYILPHPNHRSGFFNTENFPLTIKAYGYNNFRYSDCPLKHMKDGSPVYPLRRLEPIDREE